MKQTTIQSLLLAALVFGLLVIDQATKLAILSNMSLGESHEVFSWFHICYVENNGMAFGIEWLPKWCLTLFRLVMSGLLICYITILLKRGARVGYLSSVSMVLAGALGNLLDCVFYGPLFQDRPWFLGRVVDMLYFPLITSSAGETLFFSPVFNFADSYITIAVFLIILFYHKDLNESLDTKSSDNK